MRMGLCTVPGIPGRFWSNVGPLTASALLLWACGSGGESAPLHGQSDSGSESNDGAVADSEAQAINIWQRVVHSIARRSPNTEISPARWWRATEMVSWILHVSSPFGQTPLAR